MGEQTADTIQPSTDLFETIFDKIVDGAVD